MTDPAHPDDETPAEPPQAMQAMTEPTEADVPLDPDAAAFDRVQDEKAIDADYEREYNRRHVKEHGDAHHDPTREPGDAA